MRAIFVCVVFGIMSACMALPLHKVEGKCVALKDFSVAQRNVILKAFKYGVKSGFGYTMAAIAWKESCAGEYRMNFADPSAGIYHAHIPGLLKKNNQKDTGFMRNMVGELLVRDDEYASEVALDELLYWQKVRNGNWKEVIKSYNKGFSWEKDRERDKMAQSYYEDIAQRVQALHGYIPKYASALAKQAKNDKALAFLGKSTALTQNPKLSLSQQSVAYPKPNPKKLTTQVATQHTDSQKKKRDFIELPQELSANYANKPSSSPQIPTKKQNPNTGEFYLLQER